MVRALVYVAMGILTYRTRRPAMLCAGLHSLCATYAQAQLVQHGIYNPLQAQAQSHIARYMLRICCGLRLASMNGARTIG